MMTTPNPQDQTTPPAFVTLVDRMRDAVHGSILINRDADSGWAVSTFQTSADGETRNGYGIGGTLDDAADMCADDLMMDL